VRDAPLTLGRTKWGVGASLRSAGQKRGCSAGQMEWEGIAEGRSLLDHPGGEKRPKDLIVFWEDTSLTLGRTKRGRSEVGGASLTLGRTKKGARQDKKRRSAGQKRALGRIKKGAWQEGARDFFETAFELKFGLAIIFAGRIFLPLIALDNDYSPFFSLL